MKSLSTHPPENWGKIQAEQTLSNLDSAYGPRLVDDYWELRNGIDAEVAANLERAEPIIERHKKSAAMGKFATEQAAARAFYDVMVRPYLLKGTLTGATKEKTFSPDQTYIDDFVTKTLDEGVVSQMYIRLLQSRPGEKPSDSRIGYGTLELLRTWAIRTKVAKELNLNYAVNIIDETEAFDRGDQLGFTPEVIEDSYAAMRDLLNRCGLTEEDIQVIPFSRQAGLYRGGGNQDSNLTREYERLLAGNIEKTVEDIRHNVPSLSAIRVVMVQRLRHGDSFTSVSANRDLDYLTDFHRDDVAESLWISESFNSALRMRVAAKQHVERTGLQAVFPEFSNSSTLLHWGISKRADRLSIQPNFKVYKGRLVTPGYALPVYGEADRQFLGLTSYTEHSSDTFNVIYGPNDLPVALTQKE